MKRPAALLTILLLLAGCRAPTPSFNLLAPYGSTRVPAPATGSYGAPQAYHQQSGQLSGVVAGGAGQLITATGVAPPAGEAVGTGVQRAPASLAADRAWTPAQSPSSAGDNRSAVVSEIPATGRLETAGRVATVSYEAEGAEPAVEKEAPIRIIESEPAPAAPAVAALPAAGPLVLRHPAPAADEPAADEPSGNGEPGRFSPPSDLVEITDLPQVQRAGAERAGVSGEVRASGQESAEVESAPKAGASNDGWRSRHSSSEKN